MNSPTVGQPDKYYQGSHIRSNIFVTPGLGQHEAEVRRQARRLENRQVREHRRKVRIANAEPGCKRGAILVESGSWNPYASAAGVIRGGEGQGGELAIYVATLHRASQNEMMVTPGVVAAGARAGLTGAAKVRFGERRNLLRDSQLHGSVVESSHGRTDLGKKRILIVDLIVVRVETAEGYKEDLALHHQ